MQSSQSPDRGCDRQTDKQTQWKQYILAFHAGCKENTWNNNIDRQAIRRRPDNSIQVAAPLS